MCQRSRYYIEACKCCGDRHSMWPQTDLCWWVSAHTDVLNQSRASGSGWYTSRAVIERGHSANISTGAYWTTAESKTAWRLTVSEAEIYQNTKHEFVFEKCLVSFDPKVEWGSYELLCYYHPHHLQSCCWVLTTHPKIHLNIHMDPVKGVRQGPDIHEHYSPWNLWELCVHLRAEFGP